MDPVLVVKMGEDRLSAAHLTVQEMVKVKRWTGLTSRREFFNAIIKEDPEALLAAYCLAKSRSGVDVRFSDADFDLDQLHAALADEDGREVEPVIKRDKNERPVLDDKGQPIPVLDKAGSPTYRYADTGEPVPPTTTA